jgi:hypothetical protein
VDYFGTGAPAGPPATAGPPLETSPFAEVYAPVTGPAAPPQAPTAGSLPAQPGTWAAAAPTWPAATAPGSVGWAPAPASRAGLPLPVLLLGIGGLLLALSSALPWVKVVMLDLSGLQVDWGIAALVGGLVALLAAAEEATGLLGSAARPLSRAGALLGGLAGAGAALAVWTKVRAAESDFAEAVGSAPDGLSEVAGDPAAPDAFSQGFEELGRQLAEAFQPSAGVGLWMALVAGALVVTGAALAFRD